MMSSQCTLSFQELPSPNRSPPFPHPPPLSLPAHTTCLLLILAPWTPSHAQVPERDLHYFPAGHGGDRRDACRLQCRHPVRRRRVDSPRHRSGEREGGSSWRAGMCWNRSAAAPLNPASRCAGTGAVLLLMLLLLLFSVLLPQGVRGMKVGGVRRLIVPPNLAYGDKGVGGERSGGFGLCLLAAASVAASCAAWAGVHSDLPASRAPCLQRSRVVRRSAWMSSSSQSRPRRSGTGPRLLRARLSTISGWETCQSGFCFCHLAKHRPKHLWLPVVW
jgi:hypothetical protein